MKPLLLDQFGDASLRRLARQSGLRGAETLPRSVLEAGLTTYLSLRPAREEAPGEEGDAGDPAGPAPDLVPPALATETMARLLEQQGKGAAAARLRLQREAPGPAPDPEPPGEDGAGAPDDVGHVRVRAASAKLVTVRYRVTEAGRRRAAAVLGPGPAQWALERVSADAAGALVVEHPALAAPVGELPWRLPPDTRAVAVAVGLRAPDGRFAAVAATGPLDLPGAPPVPGERPGR